jgi:hypothetical protein
MPPSPASGGQFCLHQNRDGTADSFCLKCFVMVSHGKSEAVRVQFENNHVCDPYDVERFRAGKTAANKSNSYSSHAPRYPH